MDQILIEQNGKKQSEALVNQAPLLSVEVAAALRIHPETCRKMIRDGRIPAIKFGRTWRVQAAEIERLQTEGV